MATLVEPLQQWQIVSSERHTTVWDGFDTLFEFNHQAMGVDAPTCFHLASTDGEYFSPHCDYDPGFAPHYTFELWLNDEPITDEAAANFRKRMTYIRDHYPDHPEIIGIFTDGALTDEEIEQFTPGLIKEYHAWIFEYFNRKTPVEGAFCLNLPFLLDRIASLPIVLSWKSRSTASLKVLSGRPAR